MTRFAYIDSLPNELLEKIFKLGGQIPMPMDDQYPHRPLFTKLPLSTLYPTSISHVCIRWREIALQASVLWCNIHLSRTLETHRRLRSNVGRSLDWVSTYITRSSGLPLHITLDTTRLPPAGALRLITPYSARWRTFTLLVSHVGSLPPILPLLVSPRVPRLQTLAIASDIYREGIVCYDPLVPFFTTSTPQLSTIHLNGVYVAWNELPLANLLNLELHLTSRWPTFALLAEMFHASPMLMRLVIQDDIASLLRHVNQPSSKPTIELPNLKHLEIQIYRVREEPADVVGLIGLFSMPSLETLALRNIKGEEWAAVTHRYYLPDNLRDLNLPAMPTMRRSSDRSTLQYRTRSFPFLSSFTVTFSTSSKKPDSRRYSKTA